jgi:HPt (histidine-containing phosphotransfer) domain-containing protein
MIEWNRVDELKREIGDDGFDEVLGLFLDEADEVIARLSNAPDLRRLEGELHFRKGSALNLGLNDLAALCQQGERMAASGNADRVELTSTLQCYHESRAALLDGLGRSSAA